jgi:hypothetical protein
MAGTKLKDKSIVTEKTATVKITMEEFTKRNLGIMLMGDVNDTDPDNITIDVFSKTALTGELRFYATNDVGPRWRFFLNQVQFTPSGDFSPISDNYANMVVTGDVFAVDGTWGTAALVTPGAPENITLPFIVGSPIEGETLTVSAGGWLDVDSSPTSGRRAARQHRRCHQLHLHHRDWGPRGRAHLHRHRHNDLGTDVALSIDHRRRHHRRGPPNLTRASPLAGRPGRPQKTTEKQT